MEGGQTERIVYHEEPSLSEGHLLETIFHVENKVHTHLKLDDSPRKAKHPSYERFTSLHFQACEYNYI